MTQVDIEQLILENGFKLESKEGHITYEFGTGDIYRISQLIFKKMNYIPCCTELKSKPILSFEDWYITYGYAKTVAGNFIREGSRITRDELIHKYKTEHLKTF